MFKIELKNRDFRKSLYFYIVDAGCWHYIKSRANIKWTLEKIWAAGACQRPDKYILLYIIELHIYIYYIRCFVFRYFIRGHI